MRFDPCDLAPSEARRGQWSDPHGTTERDPKAKISGWARLDGIPGSALDGNQHLASCTFFTTCDASAGELLASAIFVAAAS